MPKPSVDRWAWELALLRQRIATTPIEDRTYGA